MRIFRDDEHFYRKTLLLNEFDIEGTFLEIDDDMLKDIYAVIMPIKYENKRTFFLAKLLQDIKKFNKNVELIYI